MIVSSNRMFATAKGTCISRATAAAWMRMGFHWLMGRVVDVVNVSGHRIGTAEVESALVSYAKVAEAAVAPNYRMISRARRALCLTVTVEGWHFAESEELKKGWRYVCAQGDPGRSRCRTDPIRAGYCRRHGQGRSCVGCCGRSRRTRTDQIGDVSTLADPGVVSALVKGKQ